LFDGAALAHGAARRIPNESRQVGDRIDVGAIPPPARSAPGVARPANGWAVVALTVSVTTLRSVGIAGHRAWVARDGR